MRTTITTTAATTTASTGKAHQILIFFLLSPSLVNVNYICATICTKSDEIYPICFLGTPPSQFIAGPLSSSPRASIPSNNSASPTSVDHLDRRMSLQTRGRRPSMFDPIDPKELQQALYASAAAVSSTTARSFDRLSLSFRKPVSHRIQTMMMN